MSGRALLCGLAVTVGGALAGLEAGELSLKERAAARKIYVAKCAKCHRFYDPAVYSASDWRRWMESMSRKSKLKRDQSELLSRYLDAYRAGQLPGQRDPQAPVVQTPLPRSDP